jgi:hypothetical protein
MTPKLVVRAWQVLRFETAADDAESFREQWPVAEKIGAQADSRRWKANTACWNTGKSWRQISGYLAPADT